MDMYHEPARMTPIAHKVDVLIVGGGPAGIAAALAAGRNGVQTLLVERFGYLGGTATASLMPCMNGFRNQVEPDATQTVRGIAEEFILRLKALNGLGKSPYPQKAYPTTAGQLEYSYAFDTEKFKYLALKLCADANVQMLFHTTCCDCILDDEMLKGVVVQNKSGRQVLEARIIIDATGDADVAARAGVSFWQTCNDEAPRLNDNLMYRIRFGATRPAGTFSCDFGDTAVVWGPSVPALNGTDGDELSRGELEARLRIYEDFAAKQAKHPELADARIVETPPMLGIRQTRFIEGDCTLIEEDALTGARFDDVIAVSSSPISNYYGGRRYLEHEGYDIPYRSMLPQEIEQLLVAGRCISSEQVPFESHRAMATVMAIGQAAGTAGALCIRTNSSPRRLDIRYLQQVLAKQGAFLYLKKR